MEEIDFEIGQFHNVQTTVTLTLIIGSCITRHWPLFTKQILLKSEAFCGQT